YYTACDTATVYLTVLGINDPPIVDNDYHTINEDTQATGDITDAGDYDPDGTALTVAALINDVNNGTFVWAADGSYTYTPDLNWTGLDTAVTQVCDGGIPNSECVLDTVFITVLPVNDPPVANEDSTTTAEDTPFSGWAVEGDDYDIDGTVVPTTIDLDPLTGGQQTSFTDTYGNLWSLVGSTISFTPATDWNGVTTINYTINDDGGLTSNDTFLTVTVTPVNDDPVVRNDRDTTYQDVPVVVNIFDNDFDVDGNIDTTSITWPETPSNGSYSFSLVTGLLTYTPDPGFVGYDTLRYRVCDDGTPLPRGCDRAWVYIVVLPVKDTVIVTIEEDSTWVICQDTILNLLGGIVSSSICDPADHGSSIVGGAPGYCVTYDPDTNYVGVDEICVYACNADGFCDTTIIIINLTPVPDPPIAVADYKTVTEDTLNVTIDVSANDSDPDGDLDPPSVTILTPPTSGGTAVVNGIGGIVYTPPANFYGLDTITYSICDLQPVCDDDTVFITILPILDPPVPTSNSAVCLGDSIRLFTNPPGAPEGPYYYSWSGPNGFTSAAADPVFKATSLTYSGFYTVTITDVITLQTNSASTQVTVNPLPATPTIAGSGNGAACLGESYTLSTDNVPGAGELYVWILPDLSMDTTLVPEYVIDPVANADSGMYSLYVVVDGCASASVDHHISAIDVKPEVLTASVLAYCENDDLLLFADPNPAGNYTYLWEGPNGWTSNVQNPIIPNCSQTDAGDYHVTIFSENLGCTDSDTTTVTVNARPPAPIFLNKALINICDGDSLTLYTYASCDSIIWLAPNGYNTWSYDSTITFGPGEPGYQSGNWSVICCDTATGCSSDSSNGYLSVAINDNPVALAMNNGPICFGDDVTLHASGSIPGVCAPCSGAVYLWQDSLGIDTLSLDQNFTISGLPVGDTTFMLVICINGCYDTAYTTVTVLPVPAAPVMPADFAVCEGEYIVLGTTTVANGYSWNGPNGFTSTSQYPAVILATLNDAGTYSLTIDSAGCASQSGTVDVSVNAAPLKPNIFSNSPICYGDPLQVYTTSSCDSNVWYMPDGTVFSTLIDQMNAPTPGNPRYQSGNFMVKCVDRTTGCESELSDPVTVVINPLPVALPTNNGPVCSGSDVILYGNTQAGASYEWFNATMTLISTNQDFTLVGLPDVTDSTFYLVVTVNGCTDTATTLVTVSSPIGAPTMPGAITLCEGEAIVLGTPTAADTYSWTGPNGFASASQYPAAIIATVLDTGYFHLSITVNGCGSNADSVLVTVNAKPSKPLLITNSPLCEGDSLYIATPSSCDSYILTGYGSIAGGALVYGTFTFPDSTGVLPTTALGGLTTYWNLVCEDATTGCLSEPSDMVTVVINERPIAFPTNSGPVCAGAQATLYGNTVPGTIPGAMYEWFDSTLILISTNQNPVVSGLQPDTNNFYLVVTDGNGCTSETALTQVLADTVLGAPQVPADMTLCAGEMIVLGTPTAADTYLWTGPNGFYSTSQYPAAFAATVFDTGYYVLSVTVNGCGSALDSVEVTVDPKPATPSILGNSPVCIGSSIELATSAVSPVYAWYGGFSIPSGPVWPVSLSSVTATPFLSFPIPVGVGLPAGSTYWYVQTAANINKVCFSDPSDTITVVVKDLPVAFPTNSGPVCEGDDVTLFGNTVPGTVPGAMYMWFNDSLPRQLISTQQNPLIGGLAAGTHNYHLVVVANGCESDTVTTTVTVGGSLVAPNVPADFAVCEGELIVLHTNTVASTYEWTGPNGFYSTLQNPPSFPATLQDSGFYVLEVRGGSGCGMDSVYVTVNPRPAKPLLITNSPICEGDSLRVGSPASCDFYTLTGYGSSAGGAIMYGTFTFTDSSGVFPTDSTSPAISYWNLICTDATTGCSSEPSDMVTVEIIEKPIAFPTNSGPAVCAGDDITLFGNTVPGTLPGTMYQWFNDSIPKQLIATTQDHILSTMPSGTYTFWLVVTANGCESDTTPTTFTVGDTSITPVVPADFAVCEGDLITLWTTTPASSYEWTGPNGFYSTLQNPPAFVATLSDSGIYILQVRTGTGCGQDTVVVDVAEKPAKPVLFSNSPVCEGDSMRLGTYSSCGAYFFRGYGAVPSGTLLYESGIILDSVTAIATDSVLGNITHWTVVCMDIISGCESDPSDPVTVEILDRPVAFPTNNGPVCYGTAAMLYGNSVPGTIPGAMWQWFDTTGALVATTQNVTMNGLTPDTYTYGLVVSNPNCSSDTVWTTFVVDSILPAPVMQADFAICEEEALVVFTTTIADTYYWTGPNGFTSGQQYPAAITSASVLDEGWYKLHYSKMGCPSDSDSVYVTVNPKPLKPTLYTNSPVCEGDSLRLGTYASCGAYTFTGYGSTPSGTLIYETGTLLDSVTAISTDTVPGNITTWTVTCIDVVTGCLSDPSDPMTVELLDRPVAFATNNGPVCHDAPIELYGNTVPGTIPGAMYEWFDTAGVMVSTLQNPIIYGLESDTYTYALLVSQGNCVSDTAYTTFIIEPILPAPDMMPDTAVCEEGTITIYTNTVADTYFWTGPDGFVSNLQFPPVITMATEDNEGFYVLHYTINGCPSDTDSVFVTVNPKPVKPVLYTNSPVCESDSLRLGTYASCGAYWFTGYGAAPSSNLIYETGIILDSVTAMPTDTLPGNITTWTVVCIDITTGCMSDPSDPVTVEILDRPVAFPTNNGPVCHDDPITLYGNTVPGTIPGAMYRWFDENDSLVSTQQNPTFYGLASGTYTYSLLVNQGNCVSDTAYTTFTIMPILPAPTMMADTAVCEDGTITLYTFTVADTYYWTGPNGFTSSLQYPLVITPATEDNEGFYVLHYSINGCPSDTDSVYVTVNPKPAKPVLFSNSPVCESDSIFIGTYSSCGNYTFLGYGTYPSGNLLFMDTVL
ncbi:MAG: tandem-95 repeat protein, partial [Bacteroidales bacterium]|nr:tandem-95 repeat protein [Bacteroidales bacterium]